MGGKESAREAAKDSECGRILGPPDGRRPALSTRRAPIPWCFALLLVASWVLAGLASVTAQAPPQRYLVCLKEGADLSAARGSRSAVVAQLRQTATRAQAPLLARLEAWQRQGEVQEYEPLWIINAVRVQASERVIAALRRDPAVASVMVAQPVTLPPAQRARVVGTGRQNARISWGLVKMGAPELWERDPAIRGAGVTVAVIDTGITPAHPQFQQPGKIRAWKDFIAGKGAPYDDAEWAHGTHVAGTIAGTNADGWVVGIAPEATLLVAKALDAQSGGLIDTAIAAMQWAMDPDGDPNTADGADIVNCSLGGPHLEDQWNPTLKSALEVLRAANILPVFAIGNSGPGPKTTVLPGDYPTAVGVGATSPEDAIWPRSSRGPVVWDGMLYIKPDITAPGEEILSCTPARTDPSGYLYSSGTSNACPHVVGAAALAISAARARGFSPTVAALEEALKSTAVDLGPAGPDNTYGAGRVDLPRFVDALIGANVTLTPPDLLSPAEDAVVRPTLSLQIGSRASSSALIRYRVALTPASGPAIVLDQTTPSGAVAFDRNSRPYEDGEVATVIVPELPPGPCEWRASASADGGNTWIESDSARFTVNLPPNPPEWVYPPEGYVLSTTPVLQIRVSDDDPGDRLKLKLVLSADGQEVRVVDQTVSTDGWSAEAGYASGEVARCTPSPTAPLPAGTYSCTAYAHDGLGWSPASAPRQITLSSEMPRWLPARLQTFALSTSPPSATREALGLSQVPMKVYDPLAAAQAGDAVAGYQDAPETLVPGRGYWLKPGTAVALALDGPAPSGTFAIALEPGWNFIGSPFPTPVPWRLASLQVEQDGHAPLPLASAGHLLEEFAFAFRPDPLDPDTGSYVLVYDSTLLTGITADRLEPWHGYWVKARAKCRLILPDPNMLTSQSAPRTGAAGWCVPVSVRSAMGARTLLLGVGARSVSAGLPPEGVAGNRLRAGLERNGRLLAADVRAGRRKSYEWEMVVGAGQLPDVGDVVVTCDLRALPRGVGLTLVDRATGARRSLRASGSYRFRPSDEPRRFQIIARPVEAAPTAITGIRLVRARSGGRALQFTLSRAAVVDAELLSPTGRIVATAARARASEAGLNLAAIPDRLGRGLYLVRVRAATEEGATTQAIRPVAILE